MKFFILLFIYAASYGKLLPLTRLLTDDFESIVITTCEELKTKTKDLGYNLGYKEVIYFESDLFFYAIDLSTNDIYDIRKREPQEETEFNNEMHHNNEYFYQQCKNNKLNIAYTIGIKSLKLKALRFFKPFGCWIFDEYIDDIKRKSKQVHFKFNGVNYKFDPFTDKDLYQQVEDAWILAPTPIGNNSYKYTGCVKGSEQSYLHFKSNATYINLSYERIFPQKYILWTIG